MAVLTEWQPFGNQKLTFGLCSLFSSFPKLSSGVCCVSFAAMAQSKKHQKAEAEEVVEEASEEKAAGTERMIIWNLQQMVALQ